MILKFDFLLVNDSLESMVIKSKKFSGIDRRGVEIHMPTEMYTLKCKDTVHSNGPLVKYGVRTSKFLWAPGAQLYSLAETTSLFDPL